MSTQYLADGLAGGGSKGRADMPKFRKKPVVIEAREYTRNGLEAEQVAEWSGGSQTVEGLHLETLEGIMLANYGDWVIKEPFPTGDREFYPCKPDIFEQTYEEVVE